MCTEVVITIGAPSPATAAGSPGVRSGGVSLPADGVGRREHMAVFCMRRRAAGRFGTGRGVSA
jgi:hypothetical protein